MKVSIVTVCLNAETTIVRMLESIKAQTHPDIEHIVIDGQSEDRTLQILRQSSYDVVSVISEPDHGIYDAMNKGLKLATGDIICFLNSDDYYSSNSVISEVVNKFESCSTDIVMGDVGYFNSDRPDRIVRRYYSRRFHPGRIAWGWMPAHPALFISGCCALRVGNFRTDFIIAGDFDFVLRLFLKDGIIPKYQYIDKMLVHMQNGGISNRGLWSLVQINREILRSCRRNNVSTNIIKILIPRYPIKLIDKYLRSGT